MLDEYHEQLPDKVWKVYNFCFLIHDETNMFWQLLSGIETIDGFLIYHSDQRLLMSVSAKFNLVY